MAKVAIIGAGVMGLAAAYQALLDGHEVKIYEAGDVPGGMAAHFDLDGLSIERFYHFICKTDYDTFQLLEELNIKDTLNWTNTYMGYYIDGKLYKWGDPVSLLRFPLMNIIEKFRYGLSAFWQTKRRNFNSIESMTARDWIVRDCGQKTYELLWKRLFELKFYEHTDEISASWIATRVRRIGRSRASIKQEILGYLEGGSETLVDALVQAIEGMGGQIILSSPVQEITSKDQIITAVRSKSGIEQFDRVISTVPTPLVSQMVPDLADAEKAAYDAIKNIGVICLTFKLKRSISRNFWMNINDKSMEIPGIIEFSNLRKVDAHVVYVPYYMPTTQPKFSWSDDEVLAEAFSYLKKINPELSDDDLIASRAFRLKHSQPICTPNFSSKLPPIQTSIQGLQIADTCFYYPEDRGISESIKIGRQMAKKLGAPSV